MKGKICSQVVFCFLLIMLSFFKTNAQNNENIHELSKYELRLINDTTLKLSDLKGKVVLFDFWHRGCLPCLKAVPELIKLQEEFKDNLVIIGVNDFNIQKDVIAYYKFKGVNFLSTFKTEKSISKELKVNHFPTTILFDKNGNLIKVDVGYSKSGIKALRKAIKVALKS